MELCPLGWWCIPESVHCVLGLLALTAMVLVAYNLDEGNAGKREKEQRQAAQDKLRPRKSEDAETRTSGKPPQPPQSA